MADTITVEGKIVTLGDSQIVEAAGTDTRACW